MNLLIIGNIATGKSSLAASILSKSRSFGANNFSIDDMRRIHSDGTHAGEFHAWANMLDLIQNPHPTEHSIYEFSGTGKNAWFVKEAMQYSMNKHKANWRVIYCACDNTVIKERCVGRVYDVPIPYIFGDINRSIQYMSDELAKIYDQNFWRVPEIVVRTDQHSSIACADIVLLSIKDSL